MVKTMGAPEAVLKQADAFKRQYIQQSNKGKTNFYLRQTK
jgi:hypothetical protein